MDFTGAFDEAASDDADVGDHETASPAAEPTYHAAEPAAASADPLELGLEEELNAMLDDAHAEPEPQSPVTFAPQAEPRPAASPVDMRWSALEEDEEETPAPAAAPTSDYRRPFIDPAIVSRLASFRATPASTPAPKIEPAPQPEADLDDLLDAMESEVHLDHDAPAAPLQHNGYAAAPAAASHEVAYADDAAPATQGYDSYEEESPADYDPAPDVETIDVPEMAVAVADDLDIPELAYEQDEPAPPAYDDLDADYGRAFVEPAMPEEPASQSQRDVTKHAEDIDFDTDFESLYRSGTAFQTDAYTVPQANGHAAAYMSAADQGYDARSSKFDEYDATKTDAPTASDRFVDLDFDSDVDEAIALPASYAARETHAAPQRRGLLIAAVVGGVALLGGVGALALSFGKGEGADVPVVVKADDGPIKVKPENPGGTTVPKQDNKVYDAVKGTDGATTTPAQEKLVTTSEEPVDMAAVDRTDDALPGVTDEDMIVPKAEDRVDPVANADDEATAEAITVTPRKVKTMVVRSDGTLVPREDPAPANCG